MKKAIEDFTIWAKKTFPDISDDEERIKGVVDNIILNIKNNAGKEPEEVAGMILDNFIKGVTYCDRCGNIEFQFDEHFKAEYCTECNFLKPEKIN